VCPGFAHNAQEHRATHRRGTDFGFLPSYIDDFVAAGLLLYAAFAVSRKREDGAVLLVMAWAIVCGGLYYSFFGQLQNATSNDISGLPSMAMVLIKGAMFVVAIIALILAVRRATQQNE
jgi:hypothetical protein